MKNVPSYLETKLKIWVHGSEKENITLIVATQPSDYTSVQNPLLSNIIVKSCWTVRSTMYASYFSITQIVSILLLYTENFYLKIRRRKKENRYGNSFVLYALCKCNLIEYF